MSFSEIIGKVFWTIILMGMLLMLVLLPLIVIADYMVEVHPHYEKTIKTECYDKLGNEVIDLKCLNEVKCRNGFWGYLGNDNRYCKR